MVRKNRQWNWLWIPVLLVVCLLTALHWDAILIRIAPKAVLTSALTDIFSQLESRFREDPLLILAKTVDPNGQYTADIQMTTENDLLGNIRYDMTLRTNGASHQLQAGGTAATTDRELDLALYMDDRFMAVVSEDLVRGQHYGITYDTFSEDLRSIPFVNFLVSDRILSQWESSVENTKAWMKRDYTLPEIPNITKDDVRKVLLGILTLPGEVRKESIEISSLEGLLECQSISYSLGGEQVAAVLSRFLGKEYAEDLTMDVIFYMYKNSLVRVKADCVSDGYQSVYSVDLGRNPAEDQLTLRRTEYENEELNDLVLGIETEKTENHYAEIWSITTAIGENAVSSNYQFEWEPSTGAMELSCGEKAGILLNLTETENGFRLVAEDFTGLLRMLPHNEGNTVDSPISCDVTVSKGSEIITPAYRNLDQWSLDDLVILIAGVGSLVGINIGI